LGSDNWWDRAKKVREGGSSVAYDPDDPLPDFPADEPWEDEPEDELPWWSAERSAPVATRTGYLDDMWANHGFRYQPGATSVGARADALVTAHKMVKTFVDTFATGDVAYRVTFDPRVQTAGTDLQNKKVVISPAPALDPTLDSVGAGHVLTAMATHEASHVRYGRATAGAVTKEFGRENEAAHRLSNILDDVRIEARFVKDYPGYTDVFKPAIDYVAKAHLDKDADGEPILAKPSLANPIGLVVTAVRYPDWGDWTGVEDERDWWIGWKDRWASEDRPGKHVEAVREGLARLALMSEKPDEPEPGKGEPGGPGDEPGPGQPGQAQSGQDETKGMADGQGSGDDPEDEDGEAGGADEDDDEDEDDGYDPDSQDGQPTGGERSMGSEPSEEDDEDGPDYDPQGDYGYAPGVTDGKPGVSDDPNAEGGGGTIDGSELPDCPADGIKEAAIRNGVKEYNIDGREAQEIVEDSATLVEVERGPYGKIKVDIRPARSLKPRVTVARTPVSGSATSAIRAAFMRSRTGSTGKDEGQKRGRLDSGSLHRVAFNDPRLFHRRHAPDPGRYLIWMLVDQSGSMSGRPTDEVIGTSKAIASAIRHMPSLRSEVFGWTSAQARGMSRGANAGVYSVWKSGENIDTIDDLRRINQGGTPDLEALAWAGQAIRRQVLPNEKPVIIMMSDGYGYGAQYMGEQVEKLRKAGVEVLGVAIGNIARSTMEQTYGPKKVVHWEGSITATAGPLARMLGKMVQT
jgi:Mg-chelatase subunit ChlD